MDLMVKMGLKNGVERVLHVPGNYTGGILEMTLVIDCCLPKDYVKNMAAEIAATLRAHSEIFRNVRLNLLYWKSDREFENCVIPISFLQMSNCFEEYRVVEEEQGLEMLSAKLKLLHARSKLILVLAGETLTIYDREEVNRNMRPFLGKKSLFLCRKEGEMKWMRGAEL